MQRIFRQIAKTPIGSNDSDEKYNYTSNMRKWTGGHVFIAKTQIRLHIHHENKPI